MTNQTSTAPARTVELHDGDHCSDPRDVLARAMGTAVAVIYDIRPDQMHLPAPCDDLRVRSLIAHLVAILDRLVMFGRQGDVGGVGVQADLVPDDEWVTRWDATVHAVLDVWTDDERSEAAMQLPWRSTTGRTASAIYTNATPQHLDLAHATGQHPAWDQEVLDVSSRAIHVELPDAERAAVWAGIAEHLPPGVPFTAPFGDAVPVPDEASPIEHLVAWNGRRP